MCDARTPRILLCLSELKMADDFEDELFAEEEDSLLAEPNLEIPADLNWIYSENGQAFFHKVLKTVGVPESETIESSAARIILSQTGQNIEVSTDFLKQISTCFLVCYHNVQQIKCSKKKTMNLERSFTTLRDNLSIKEKWFCLLRSCGLQTSDGTNILLNHVLQHFWSCLVSQKSHEFISEHSEVLNFSINTPSSSSPTQPINIEDIEVQSIKEHAGWVCKRVREAFNSGPEIYKIPISKTNTTLVEVDKQFILSLIKRLGHDVLIQPGKFLFIAIPEVVEVFIYLHNTVERIVKDGLGTHADKDILKKCLKLLSEDIHLRKMWYKVLGDEVNEHLKSGSVLLLQRTVAMFLKSKQQIIREQLQLKPNKQSSSLRQSLSKKQKPMEKKQLSKSDEYVIAFRQNPMDVSQVMEFLTNVFEIPSQAPVILKKLHGQELTAILLSLGLPGLNGKGKQHQIEKLVKHNADRKHWNIIFPDKLKGNKK